MSDEQTVETTEKTQSEAAATPPAGKPQAQTGQTEPQDASLLETAEGEEIASGTENKEEPQSEQACAPEKYEDFKAPQGVVLDTEVVKNFSAVAKELNLPQEKAQMVIDKLAPVVAKQQLDQVNKTNQAWKEKVQNDPLIGGANLKVSLTTAAKALRPFKGADGKISDPDIAEITAIAGNHPGLIKILRHYGAAVGEDKSPTAKSQAAKTVFTAEDFYRKKE